MMKSVLLLLAFCVSTSLAWFNADDDPEWDGLRASFGFNLFRHYTFTSLPRTREDAIQDGWVLDLSAGACNVSGTAFRGNRYRKDGDAAAMLLFDKNGFIAGVQAGIPKNDTRVYPGPQHKKYGVFTEESDLWVITAYFIEPSKICSTGRNVQEFNEEGTGTMLAIQTGPTPESLMRAPLSESEVTSTTNFVQGKCFYGMGMHYWYNVSSDMSCDDTFPAFLMYNEGRLTAFGWAFNIYYDTSKRWEHPNRGVFGNFINNVPKCLGVNHTVTTLHMYLTSTPWFNRC